MIDFKKILYYFFNKKNYKIIIFLLISLILLFLIIGNYNLIEGIEGNIMQRVNTMTSAELDTRLQDNNNKMQTVTNELNTRTINAEQDRKTNKNFIQKSLETITNKESFTCAANFGGLALNDKDQNNKLITELCYDVNNNEKANLQIKRANEKSISQIA